jgi:hypothetical protein
MTTTIETRRIVIAALDPELLDLVRSRGHDSGDGPVVRLTAEGDEPLRCCLRTAIAGEQLILFGYQPDLPPCPYLEIGPVFAHADGCAGERFVTDYPADWIGRPQVLRAYDGRGWIRDARVHDGRSPMEIIEEMLTDPDVVQLHSRNVAYGCYMFAVRRSGAAQ